MWGEKKRPTVTDRRECHYMEPSWGTTCTPQDSQANNPLNNKIKSLVGFYPHFDTGGCVLYMHHKNYLILRGEGGGQTLTAHQTVSPWKVVTLVLPAIKLEATSNHSSPVNAKYVFPTSPETFLLAAVARVS